MSKKNDRIVYRRDDGKWMNKKLGADRARSLHDTQGGAVSRAREQLGVPAGAS